MAKFCLTSGFVQNPPACPSGKGKIDYYDTQLPGFLLGGVNTGLKTYAFILVGFYRQKELLYRS